MTWDGRILADARHLPIPDESVQMCVTSPPYWGLRDYGNTDQIGLERTPDDYVASLLAVFREVWRVLKTDGTLWLNIGDCYATGAGKVGEHPGGGEQGARWRGDIDRIRDRKRGYRGERLPNGRGDQPADLRKKTRADRDGSHAGKHTAITAMGPMTQPNRMPIPGLKPKDLIGIPWRVAFALQADGWWLRSDIIWAKKNCMPESVLDRPTRSHEYLFLLSKSERYFYDHEAIKEEGIYAGPNGAQKSPYSQGFGRRTPAEEAERQDKQRGHSRRHAGFNDRWDKMTKEEQTSLRRNKRDVWWIGNQPYPEAHYATFPPDLVEPCILAGSKPGDIVLDPFFGSGTVGMVAEKFSRRWIGCDLGYQALQAKRLKNVQKVLL